MTLLGAIAITSFFFFIAFLVASFLYAKDFGGAR